MRTISKFAMVVLVTALTLIQSGVATAAENTPPDSTPSVQQTEKKSCFVQFGGIPISVQEHNTYVEVEYTFDENCKPILTAIRQGQIADLKETQTAVTSATSESTEFSLTSGSRAASFSTSVCYTETWEEDVIGLDVVKAQNETTFNWGGGVLQFWGVLGRSWEYFSWWYRSSGPNQNGWWDSYPIAAKGKVDASYYCNGGPFCQGGPMYHITLEAWTRVDAWGGCSGWGVYSGTVIPAGRVLYRNWRVQ